MKTVPLIQIASLTMLVACNGESVGPPIVPELTLEPVVSGLGFPLYLTAPPGETDRLFVLEKGGWIKIIRDGAVVDPPFLDWQARLPTGGEQGILGLAFHPDFAGNGIFFVDYTAKGDAVHVSRFQVSTDDPDRADPNSEQILLTIPKSEPEHNGGMLAFGPRDGDLYISVGDGGGTGDPDGNGQSRSTLLGAILRVSVSPTGTFSVPEDNPFVDLAGARGEIWSYGFRNPWRFSLDRETGDLYVGDVGQTQREEIDVADQALDFGRGVNFGWDVMEGTHCYDAPTCDGSGLTPPVVEYEHTDGCAVTGGYVYRGAAIPSLRGTYFYADFCNGWVRSFRLVNGQVTDEREWPELAPGGRITSFGEDGAGELYILTAEGVVSKIVVRD